ncbi:MAG: acyltransferase [Hydrogenophaga sp.]|uniref:acyltransferase family protein n=1 Tax=Hydrogenophaga sp. TaxID=1904254 RepID=UPI0025B8F621|nr:acyltransferase family protein [Hydrogenophaga sp.]MBT9551209.1 acyltransferase [Hydrogenophaga sp.]
MSTDSTHSHYRPDIDGLRAIAVVSVVLHHAFPEQIQGGFVGVDIFFVISGYLISSIILAGLQKQRFSFIDFYARRIKRIFPALLLVLTTVIVMGWFQLLPVDYKQVGKHILAGSAFVSNFAFWNEAGYFDAASANKPLLHLWSLAIEEQFYMFWPLTLWAVHRWRLNAMRWIAVLMLVSFLINLYLVRGQITAAFYNPASRFWELLVGAMLAAMHVHRVGLGAVFKRGLWTDRPPLPASTPNRSNLLAWTGAGLLLLVLLTITPERRFPGWWALLPTLGSVFLIAAGPHAWFNRHVLASKPFVWIGLISYPLYLWHWPLLSFAHIETGDLPRWEHQTGWVLLAVALAWLTYQLVEKPIRFGRLNRKTMTASLCVAMTLAAASGYATYRNDGFDHRFPDIVRNMMSKGGRTAIIEGWRDKDCMLDYKLPPSNYKAFCIEKKRPLVFIWGDSHAGSLYPGFKALQESGKYTFGLGERTAAICPSVLGIEPRPLCKSLNDDTIQAIRDARPDVVILYSWWHNKRYDLRNLEATVQEIKKAGVPRIIMLGAVPYWKKHLPQILLEEWKKGPVQARPPLRLPEAFLDPEVRAATARMRTRAQQMGIEFISGMDFFCNAQGCLTRMTDDAVQPLSYDYGHLSTGAMVHYVEQLAPLIFRQP